MFSLSALSHAAPKGSEERARLREIGVRLIQERDVLRGRK